MANLSKEVLETLQKRRKLSISTQKTTLLLIEHNENSPILKTYWNTYHCKSLYIVNDNQCLRTHYCKNKHCQGCCYIQSMVFQNKYGQILKDLKDPRFVTLTRKTVKTNQLKSIIELQRKQWRLINQKATLKTFREKYGIFSGLLKMEITVRPDDKVHLHIHFLIEGIAAADWLISEHLRLNPRSSKKAQSNIPWQSDNFKELFKYVFKPSKDMENPTTAKQWNSIFLDMRKVRTFIPFGILRGVTDEYDESDLKGNLQTDLEPGTKFSWHRSNHYETETGEELVELPLPVKYQKIVQSTTFLDKESKN